METTTASNKFADFIASSDKPVLVDFYADWCGPCRMMAPILNELKSIWGDRIRIIKVDTERQPQIAAQFQISGIPTLILFKGGKPVHRTSGVMPVQRLVQEYGRYL
jgi:thioredoxin 1